MSVAREAGEAGCQWSKARERALLAVPGPTELSDTVVSALAQPALIHYDPAFDEETLLPTLQLARRLFQTEHDALLLPGSGRTALEAGVASCVEPGDRVLGLVAGRFGRLLFGMCEAFGARCFELTIPDGEPLDVEAVRRAAAEVSPTVIIAVHNETATGTAYSLPEVGRIAREHDALLLADTVSSLGGVDVPTDGWCIDVNMAASHKCIGGPLGLAVLAVGPRAWQKMEQRRTPIPSATLSLLKWKREWLAAGGADQAGRRQPVGLPSQVVFGFRRALELALAEGLEHRFLRHRSAAGALRAGLFGLGLKVFGKPEAWSDTVCCFQLPDGVDSERLMVRMRDQYGIAIAPGIGKYRANTARVGVMGLVASPACLLGIVSALELALCDLGAKVEPGAGVGATQRTIARVRGASV